MIVGDNVDVGSKRRHYMINKQNQDLHLFHAIAVCHNFLDKQKKHHFLIKKKIEGEFAFDKFIISIDKRNY